VQDGFGLDRTLDLASTLEGGNDLRMNGDAKGVSGSGQMRSVLTIAFQFAYEVHTRDTCAAMARQYVRTVVASVQRVAMALAPSRGAGPRRQVPSNLDALSLARHVLSSYRWVFQLKELGLDIIWTRPRCLSKFWHDEVMCSVMRVVSVCIVCIWWRLRFVCWTCLEVDSWDVEGVLS
jgi:homeobox-leucine zipper protein